MSRKRPIGTSARLIIVQSDNEKLERDWRRRGEDGERMRGCRTDEEDLFVSFDEALDGVCGNLLLEL